VAGVDAVVHTAYARSGPRSRHVNVQGAAVVAGACRAAGAVLVHVSSDVVFPGAPPRPTGYRESDPTGPLPGFAYGQQKADAEAEVRRRDPDATIVRLPLLYDLAGGSSLEAMVIAGAEQGSAVAGAEPASAVAHFTDEYRSPAHVEDVAAAIVSLLELPTGSRPAVLHLGGPERMSRWDLARRLAPHLGIDPASLRAGRSADLPGPRPADLTLDSTAAGALLGYRPRTLHSA
jgi:dTDP-4-dehydrorhamnose reductase